MKLIAIAAVLALVAGGVDVEAQKRGRPGYETKEMIPVDSNKEYIFSASYEILKTTANEQDVSISEALAPIVAALEKNVTPEGIPIDRALPVFLKVLRFHAQVKGVPVAEALPAALDALKEYAQTEKATIAQMLKMGMMEKAQSSFPDEEKYEEEEAGGGVVNCWYECFNGKAAVCCNLDGVFQGCGGTSIPCGDDEVIEAP
jgi:hypothetical protein